MTAIHWVLSTGISAKCTPVFLQQSIKLNWCSLKLKLNMNGSEERDNYLNPNNYIDICW